MAAQASRWWTADEPVFAEFAVEARPYKDEWSSTRSASNGNTVNSGSFKDFLRKKHGARINIGSIEQASLALTKLPDDFVELGNQIRTLGYLGVPDDLEHAIR